MALATIRLTLSYDGTHYHGWQVQPATETIQGRIERSLRRITLKDVTLIGAGRTDAGVHALGQVAAFSVDTHLPPHTIMRALNAILPADIRILDAGYAPDGFHPRFSARAKRYAYVISMGGAVSPFLYRYCWHIGHPLDVTAMATAAGTLTGKHDFKSFCASDTDIKTTIREVTTLGVEQLPLLRFMDFGIAGDFLRVSIEADGFLRHMVRNIVGTLVAVGRGRLNHEGVRDILEAKDRRRAGENAPARGLFLERVFY
ncbi:MAG: tRNA pseudouridine(38-40) synthase TruA [Nitrospirae bacterium]|uniref:tRNA pseudouridine(38-40) synthase TruA n=1 Tax=Candidatus Magnetobacterium casense TaxID=1455061 RepID=UPI00058C2E86|nr:tRNA pseudouridine(38-40) synthase TruA [Candidatus Magnetobacterium casensis]MBF0338816.1 tRNA pseudouridine(38-40) synthase TruA [Nitrospirota bacterium]